MSQRLRRIIYFDIDSLKPAHLGCYGYDRPTSPTMDRIAREGVRFATAYTSDAPCMPSRCATFTGRLGIHSGVVTHGVRGETVRPGPPMVPALLEKNGIRTCTVASFGRHPAPWFYAPWREVLDPAPQRHFQRNYSHEINALATDWLQRHAREEFFLHLQYWDPHIPYDLPATVHEPFFGYPPTPWPTPELIDRHLREMHPLSARFYGLTTPDDIHRCIQKYDAQIRYTDDHIGGILDTLARLGILDETLIVITGDHGDAHGEYGVYMDHGIGCEATLRVPLLLRAPEMLPQGRVVSDGMAYAQDAIATVLDYCGIAPQPGYDFRSLLPVIRGEQPARPFLVSGHGLCSAMRLLRTPEWLLRKVYHPGLWNLPPWSLFRIAEDPHEERDLLHQQPAVFGELKAALEAWEAEQCPDRRSDPMWNLAEEGPFGYDKQIQLHQRYARWVLGQ